MALPITIRTRCSEYSAELDENSDMANAFWFSLPYSPAVSMLGDSFYFEIPDMTMEVAGDRSTVFEAGDIAYWPGVNAIVVMFGPTPLSGEDGKPVWKYGLIRIGRIIGDLSGLDRTGDRQKVTFLKRRCTCFPRYATSGHCCQHIHYKRYANP